MYAAIMFQSPSIPVLLQILSGSTSATDLLPAGSVYTLPGNSTIELSLSSGFPVSCFLGICLTDVLHLYKASNTLARYVFYITGPLCFA